MFFDILSLCYARASCVPRQGPHQSIPFSALVAMPTPPLQLEEHSLPRGRSHGASQNGDLHRSPMQQCARSSSRAQLGKDDEVSQCGRAQA